MAKTKRISPKRRLSTMDRVEMAQTGRKPAHWPRPQPTRNRKKK